MQARFHCGPLWYPVLLFLLCYCYVYFSFFLCFYFLSILEVSNKMCYLFNLMTLLFQGFVANDILQWCCFPLWTIDAFSLVHIFKCLSIPGGIQQGRTICSGISRCTWETSMDLCISLCCLLLSFYIKSQSFLEIYYNCLKKNGEVFVPFLVVTPCTPAQYISVMFNKLDKSLVYDTFH